MKTLSQYTLEQTELAHIAIEEAYKVGAKVVAGGKKGVVQSRGGDYYDVHHEDGKTAQYHVRKIKPDKPLVLEAKEADSDRIEAGRKYLQHAQEHARYSNAEKTAANKKEAAYHKRAMEKYRQMMDKDRD